MNNNQISLDIIDKYFQIISNSEKIVFKYSKDRKLSKTEKETIKTALSYCTKFNFTKEASNSIIVLNNILNQQEVTNNQKTLFLNSVTLLIRELKKKQEKLKNENC